MQDPMIEWQLPVKDDLINGTGYSIRGNAKIHCYYKGKTLCNNHCMIPGYFETTDYGTKDIDIYPEYFCKRCVKKYKKLYDKGRQ